MTGGEHSWQLIANGCPAEPLSHSDRIPADGPHLPSNRLVGRLFEYLKGPGKIVLIHLLKTQADADKMVAFYDVLTQYLKRADPHHLVCAGGFNHMRDGRQFRWWERIYLLPANDIVAYKTYSQHDLDLIPSIGGFARAIGKPAIDQEFGLPQYMGDATWSGKNYNNIHLSRADFFKEVYEAGLREGVVGFQFWNLGTEVKPGSYEISPSFKGVWSVIRQFSPAVQAEHRQAAVTAERLQK